MVRPPQVKVGRHRSTLQDRKEMLGRGFHQLAVADEIKGFVSGRALPAGLCGAGTLLGNDGVQNVLPSARSQRRVTVLQINLGRELRQNPTEFRPHSSEFVMTRLVSKMVSKMVSILVCALVFWSPPEARVRCTPTGLAWRCVNDGAGEKGYR